MLAILLPLVVIALQASDEPQLSDPSVLQVGHVVEIRGSLDEEGRFVAEKIELAHPTSDEVLIGAVPQGQTDPRHFELLGQPVETAPETEWKNLEPGSLAGKRVKVEGSWKGPRKFVAELIEARGEGRDRIAGRLDDLRRIEGGWEARVMRFTVLVPDGTEVEHDRPVQEYGLAPERKSGVPRAGYEIARDEDDTFGRGIVLTDDLRLLGQLELNVEHEKDYDLNDRSAPNDEFDEDRTDTEGTARMRIAWMPRESLVGVAELRYRQLYRRDDDDGINDSEVEHGAVLGETWLQFRDIGAGQGLDVTVGRQDFDDEREWIYDQNLDALRLTWIHPAWRLDLSGATTLTDGSNRDEESWNLIAYLSNNDDDRHLAAWSLYRDVDAFHEFPEEQAWHTGVRAIGEWLPRNESWAELAVLVGDRGDTDVRAWAYDVGTTWSPRFAAPLYFTAGYALGSGDSDLAQSYRQTGYQDNTARFGGVTSFSYYGELFEPELSNMGILTLGAGARPFERTSLDLVFHTYTQDVAQPLFSPRPGIEANLDQQPNGDDADLGWELDAIVGYRRIRSLDVEVVGAMFEPGSGFDESDTAYFLKLQLRYRF